jgi:archaeosine-15-forming tRNA-guanine transglycosylase|tara:strand:- start:849 stop:1184 length:336 start_codon:yes stop_codon:yes gene_type:complete
VANIYKNAQFDLTTTGATDIYTVPSNSRAIVQNIHMANIGAGNVIVHAHIYDSSATTQYTFAKHTIAASNSQSVADGTIVLEENDILRVQADTANDIEGTASILEINREDR